MTKTKPLYRVRRDSLDSAVDTLTDAFADDPGIARMKISPRSMRTLHEMQARHALREGKILATSEHCEGVLLFHPDDRAGINFWGVMTSGVLLRMAPLLRMFTNKTTRQVITTIESDRKKLDIGPYYYLSVIGVRRDLQGQGHGGRLLRWLIDRADADGKSIYLETQTAKNVALYERFGFEVVRRLEFEEWLTMWEMMRPLGAQPLERPAPQQSSARERRKSE